MAAAIAAGTNFREVIEKRAWFAGNPEETIAYLKEIEVKYPGLEQMMVAFPMGATIQQFREKMTRFAREVMPAFGQQRVGL